MRVIVQRVKNASVSIDQKVYSAIKAGILVFVGITADDTEDDIKWLTKKILNLRIFNDENGVMNCSLLEVQGELLVISQFTLMASCKKGNRPSYIKAARPEIAIPLYEQFIAQIETGLGREVAQGVFGADMQVALINDGPVTILLDSVLRD